MEVHQHTHTPRKKFKHYFWEFLMLFLAVFCGFLAEYKLEHTIEHTRERQYMTTLIEDLRSDTAQLAQNISLRMEREKMIDSLFDLITSINPRDHGNDIYYLARQIPRPLRFFPNDRTLLQLKFSGGLRLIRKIDVSDSIMYYDQQTRLVMTTMEDETEMRMAYRDHVMKIFDAKVLFSMMDKTDPMKFLRPENNPQLVSTDPLLINEFLYTVHQIKQLLRAVRARELVLKERAANLIVFIRKAYHIS